MDGALLHRMKRALLAAGWAGAVAAPFVTHFAIATGRFTVLAGVLAVVELALLATVMTRGLRGWRLAGAVGFALLLLALLAVRLVSPGAAGLLASSGLSHACIYASLLLLFSRSLQPGRVALVTGLATRFRGELTPEIAAYTRNVTKAWCGFFTLQLLLSVALLLFAPARVWSLFVNVLDAPMVGLMFAAEYALRRWRFRGERHISPMETVRSFARFRAR